MTMAALSGAHSGRALLGSSSERNGAPPIRRLRRLSPMTIGGFVFLLFAMRQAFRQLPSYDLTMDTAMSLPSVAVQDENDDELYTLSRFPRGKAMARPALTLGETETPSTAQFIDSLRATKGSSAVGEPKHLGAIGDYNEATISPAVWRTMVERMGVRSVVDIGCGRGYAASWFLAHGLAAIGVEGSHRAVQASVLPQVIEHDFTLGPWWPDTTVDAAWVAGFVQQVSRGFERNYLAALTKTAIVVVSTPQDAGWHHVEVHSTDYWIQRLELHGFRYSKVWTKELRQAARREATDKSTTLTPTGRPYDASQLYQTLMVRTIVLECLQDSGNLTTNVAQVFVNPRVTSLAAHAHLFPEHGCYKGEHSDGSLHLRECAIGAGARQESPLDKSLYPPLVPAGVDANWVRQLQQVFERDRKGLAAQPAFQEAHPIQVVPSKPIELKDHTVNRIPEELAKGNTSLPVIPVVVWPYWEFGTGNAESLHIEENGINESPLLKLSTNIYEFDPNVVWVGDTGYAYGWNYWCGKFLEHIRTAKDKRAELGLPLQWPIYIVDFTDGTGHQRCKDIEQEIGPEYVKYSQRAIVQNRYWNNATGWVSFGFVIKPESDGVVYRHAPLVVRTDTIDNLRKVLLVRNHSLDYPIEKLPRETDVTHLWPLDKSGISDVSSNLRSRVSEIIADMGNRSQANVFVGLAGQAIRTGRRGVVSAYIEALLDTKIMVVTQRDGWEDHYRLFEALIAGPMVMTDRMLSLPAGLQNGTSIVEFTSEEDLRSKILYYLAHDNERLSIAHEGRKVAMTRHRTWHRIEEVIFGDVMTRCSGRPDSKCPYIVHASESRRR